MSFRQIRSTRFNNTESVGVKLFTYAATSLTNTTATGNGEIVGDGGSAITEMGFVWATTVNPTTANSKVTATIGFGIYSASITSLTIGTLYHYRAYLINGLGTFYGNDITFTTTGAVKRLRDIIMNHGVIAFAR